MLSVGYVPQDWSINTQPAVCWLDGERQGFQSDPCNRLGKFCQFKLDGVADETRTVAAKFQRQSILGDLVQPTELAAFRRRRAAKWAPVGTLRGGI